MQINPRPRRFRFALLLLVATSALALVLGIAVEARALLFQTIPTMTPHYTLPPAPTATNPPGPGATDTAPPPSPVPPGETPTRPAPTAPVATVPVAPPLVTAVASPDAGRLEISKQVSRQDVLPGEEVRYTISIKNAGSGVATGIILRDLLDPSLDLLRLSASDGAADVQGQQVLLSIGTLEPSQVCLVMLDVRVNGLAAPGQVILNQATVYYDGGLADSQVAAIGLPPDHLPATGAQRRQP